MAGQFVKGLLFLAIEVLFFGYLFAAEGGIYYLKLLPSLGDREMQEIWDPDEFVYKYIMGDDSKLILLYGVVAIFCIAGILIVWHSSVCSGYKAISQRRRKEKVPGFLDDIKSLFDGNVHKLLGHTVGAQLFNTLCPNTVRLTHRNPNVCIYYVSTSNRLFYIAFKSNATARFLCNRLARSY